MKKMVSIVALFSTIAIHATNAPLKPPEKAALCAACHGLDGKSSNPAWPHIAGQHTSYAKKQLKDFKNGSTRKAAGMSEIAAALSDEEIEELANYYAILPSIEGSMPARFRDRGEQLYRGGDFEKRIPACIACHGPQGQGNAPAGFPALSGQNAIYTLQQLKAFKNKSRQNDLNHIMSDIGAHMTKEDMEAVAWYIQGLY